MGCAAEGREERCGGAGENGERAHGLEVGDDPDRWGPPVRVGWAGLGWDLFY